MHGIGSIWYSNDISLYIDGDEMKRKNKYEYYYVVLYE